MLNLSYKTNLIVIFLFVGPMLLLACCEAIKTMLAKKRRVTAEQIEAWHNDFEPNDDIVKTVNEWLGNHTNATYSEFDRFATELLASHLNAELEAAKITNKYPNINKLGK